MTKEMMTGLPHDAHVHSSFVCERGDDNLPVHAQQMVSEYLHKLKDHEYEMHRISGQIETINKHRLCIPVSHSVCQWRGID